MGLQILMKNIREEAKENDINKVYCLKKIKTKLGRINTCICMAESLHCSFETTTALLTGYTPIQNKKFKV